MSQKFVQTQAIALYSGMAAAATSCIVTPYPRDIQTNTKLVFADFGTTPTITVDPKIPGYEEIISFTGITDNGDDTATLTGLIRNLIGQSPYTTPGTGKQHGSSAVVVFSDNPQMYARLASKENDNTYTGLNIFSGYAPQTDTDPVAANDLTRLSYVQALVLGTLTTINVIVPGTAGVTVAAGNSIYFDDATNQWKKTDATSSSTVDDVLLGIAQGAGTAGNPITNGVLLQGVDAHQTGLTDGQTMYASNTPGAISNSAGTIPVVLGISKGTTQLYFAPRFNQQVTQNQINAMAGDNTDIAVGTGNKFVTQTGLQKSAETYAATATGNDTYVITLTPVPISLVDGMTLRFKADVANTGPATLNVNSLGALSIVTGLSTALVTGAILANQVCEVTYNSTGTVWELMNPASVVLSDPTAALLAVTPNTSTTADVYYSWTVPLLISKTISASSWMLAGFVASDAAGSIADPGNDKGAGGVTTINTSGFTGTFFATIPGNGSNQNFTAASTKAIRMKFRAKIAAQSGGNFASIGLVDAATTLDDVQTSVAICARFALNNATLYAATSDGVNNQATDISASLTLTSWNVFEIVFTPGTSIVYYINGVVVATHATNLPTGSVSGFGLGQSNARLFGQFSPITFSLQQ